MAIRPGKKRPNGTTAPPIEPPRPPVARQPFANPANRGRDTRGIRSTREFDTLLEQRLSVLKEQTAAYFAAGGKAGRGSIPKLRNPTSAQKFIDPGRIVRALDRLTRDIGSRHVGNKVKLTSGFERRGRALEEAIGLRDKIMGQSKLKYITGAGGKVREGKFGSIEQTARMLRQQTKEFQLKRDSRVAETAAAQRNAIARRRNLQLTPGSRSELNIRSRSIFAQRRGGTIY